MIEVTFNSLEEIDQYLRDLSLSTQTVRIKTRVGPREYKRYKNPYSFDVGGWVASNARFIPQENRASFVGEGVVIHGPSIIGASTHFSGQTSIPPHTKVGFGEGKSFVSFENVTLRGDLEVDKACISYSKIGGNGHITLTNVDLGRKAFIEVENEGDIKITHQPKYGICRIADGLKIHASKGKVYLADLSKTNPNDPVAYHIPAHFQCRVGDTGDILVKYSQLPSSAMSLGVLAAPIQGNLYIINCALYPPNEGGVEILLDKGSCIGLMQSALKLPSRMKTEGLAGGESPRMKGGFIFIAKAGQANRSPVSILNNLVVEKGGILCFGHRKTWDRDIQGCKIITGKSEDGKPKVQMLLLAPGSRWLITSEEIVRDGQRVQLNNLDYLRDELYGALLDIADTRVDHERITHPLMPLPAAPARRLSSPSSHLSIKHAASSSGTDSTEVPRSGREFPHPVLQYGKPPSRKF